MIVDGDMNMSDVLYVNAVVFAHVYSADDGTDNPTPRAVAAADQFMANKPVLLLFDVQTWDRSGVGKIGLMHRAQEMAHLLGCIEMWMESLPEWQVRTLTQKKDEYKELCSRDS